MPNNQSSQSIDANRNEDAMRLLWAPIRDRIQIAAKGGGQKRIDKEHAKGKKTARERLQLLFDEHSKPIEIGGLAGEGMYQEHGGCPAGGVVVQIGKILGRTVVAVANDATVKAGAWFPITGKKNLRAQEIAMENRIPIIYLVDSAGVFLPMQDEIFPDKEHFGRMFRNNAKMSAMGIPQIAAVMGSCVAGGAYLPIMSDEALIVEGTGSIFLAGSFLVRAAIGEDIDNETLGGADTHSTISGVTDYKCKNDDEALYTIRKLIGHQRTEANIAGFDQIKSLAPSGQGICSVLPSERNQPYETRTLITALVDADSFTEYKKEYGKTIITGYARIDGWSVGIVANQRKLVKSKKDGMQFGGVIYSDSADKSARFIMNCNQKGIPLVFLQDVTGFMVGSRSEHGGIIKDGAKMVNAVANSTVPKFTVIVGNSYGAGNYAMCGKAYDPRLIVAWPTAQLAVMGGEQAAKVLQQIELARLKKQGEKPNEAEQKKMFDAIESRYKAQTSPIYAAARLWVDAIIDPEETRHWISSGIEMASHAPLEAFRTGVIQT
ncbi:MAG: acyl-CoA carboxylase subunit beta [Flavobacteriales bacterium]|nr:acyl-CoA carboxylase subunit beta [Flavobacteriales bacterium]